MTGDDALVVLPDAVEQLLAAFDDLDAAEDREAALEALYAARAVRAAVEPLAVAAGRVVRERRHAELMTSKRVYPKGRRRRNSDDGDADEWSASEMALSLAEEML